MNACVEYILKRAHPLFGYGATLHTKILRLPRTKFEKFKYMFSQDEASMRALDTFLNDQGTHAVFLILNTGDTFTATLDIPEFEKLRRKCLVVYRRKLNLRVSPESVDDSLVFSELNKNLVSTLNGLCNSVYQVVLDNPANRIHWSDLVSHDLMDKFHSFTASLSVTAGLVEGKTFLPFPPKEALLTSEDDSLIVSTVSKEKVHVLEGYIVTWTKQIGAILMQEPEKAHAKNHRAEPMDEIEFWKNKSVNLESILVQLNSTEVQSLIESLAQFDSAYTTPFTKLRKDLKSAAAEASDNVRFLSTLIPIVSKLTSEPPDFSSLTSLFDPILHYVLLIWKHSTYYNQPSRLVILLRLVCNSIIFQSQRFISGQQVFAMVNNEEAAEAFDKVQKVLVACTDFKERYDVYKSISEQQQGMTAGWKIQSSSVFEQLDAFRERCRHVMEFIRTIIQYTRLEKLEIGGTKGGELSRSIQSIHKDFKETVSTFQSVGYDIMTVDNSGQFERDFFNFKQSVKGLDRRLCFVATSAFDDLDTIVQRIKLLDSFEGLWERSILQEELDKRFQALIAHYKRDLREVHKLYMQDRSSMYSNDDDCPMYLNLPPVAGALYWARSLLGRIQEPLPKLYQYSRMLRDKCDEFKEVEKLQVSLTGMIEEYENQIYSCWESDSIRTAQDKLEHKLIVRKSATGLIGLNFDPAIVCLLKEIKYLKYFGFKVPQSAIDMFNRSETYRKWTNELENIIVKYNSVLTQLLPVEEPLLQDKVVLMDKVLSPGIVELEWKDEEKIGDFIKAAKTVIGDVASVVNILKTNLSRICLILSKWSASPFLERKQKPMQPEEFDSNHKAVMGVKLLELSDDAKEIHKLIRDSNEALRVSKQSMKWKAYLDFINNIIVEGYVQAVCVSLRFLCGILDPFEIDKSDIPPLFDINFQLCGENDRGAGFDPPFSKTVGYSSVREIVESWIRDFFSIASVMTRVDYGGGDYMVDVETHSLVQALLCQVSDLIDSTETKLNGFRDAHSRFSFLWTDSVDSSFDLFLSNNLTNFLSNNEFEENGLKWNDVMSIIGLNELNCSIVDLRLFDENISKLDKLKGEVSQLKNPTDIDWIRINSQNLKISLIQFITKWQDKYFGFLNDFVAEKIGLIDRFMVSMKTGLSAGKGTDSPMTNKELYTVMTSIKDVKLGMNALKLVFGPLREMMNLLKKHGRPVPESLLVQFDQIPVRWDEIVRCAFDEKERILPFQNMEMDSIRFKIDSFQKDVESFRSRFTMECPFSNMEVENAYGILDRYQAETFEMTAKGKEYNNLELLFDLSISGYKDLKLCHEELGFLRSVWEMIASVESSFSNWNELLWDTIDTDDLLLRVKDIMSKVKAMPKEVKTWKIYNWLVDQVKNMSTVLPLIADLHSDTMRDRHWRQLMDISGVSFIKGPEFSFRNVLELKLFRIADEVGEIVAQSSKEFKIEKKLNLIKSTWLKLTVEFDRSREDSLPLLTNLGAILEVLESHSLEILGIVSQGRFIEFCKNDVDEWNHRLGTIDSVLTVWQKVMRNWSRLEPIFLLSDDIRSQLPEDSKRFEAIDREWKEMMTQVGQESRIVDICCSDGRFDLLSRFNAQIELCEKSLNDYLEEKKKIFPRFYFVANQALLDILSNGNKPLKVAQYLGDCFDGIKTLQFDKEDERIAHGIISKDSETVAFHDFFKFEGSVETYLSGLEQHVRDQLRDILEQARMSADNWEIDKPREIWLQDYCAQLALVASQIVWTEETARAFEELESGSENVMKDYKRVCDDRIEKLIKQVQQPLSPDLRNKIITIITIDVHARDVIDKFVQLKLTDSGAFQWQSQLRFYWNQVPSGSNLVSFTDEAKKTCLCRIADWTSVYAYEYIGNCGRLVITPLTDRCYLTLTQALNLVMGSAPAGPAGTGKTETTKDLSRAIGLPIVVFNCSDQMSYLSMAQICKGLASSGAWGCFDEFNRISIEVLSVVTTQVKSVLDAIKENASKFTFMDDEIKLVRTCGFFITMNPGYAGRTELPESLKSLFRSCAMVVPDLTFICENMLLSEGFIQSRHLARKFVCLYSLCKELLSPQMHYDWGLRAVKSLLRQAGTLKRADPDMDEYAILMRALRDFNTPKIVTEDLPIFLRLISDLFPGTTAEPKSSLDVEKLVQQVAKERGLQPDPGFVTKVIGLLDILRVRHCCFIIGPPGSAKTQVWKTLMDTLRAMGQDGMYETLNPKAITSDELYGIMTKTKEWRDGAISVIMRNMSKEINGYKPAHLHKWIVLDGDIDAKWIESMNTVMDDNKILTLVSNERIPFTPTMRMILEVQDMLHASPATVSRGGVLFINESDIGWKPLIESWREKLENPIAQSTFYLLFNNYFETNIEHIRKNFAFTCPVLDIGFVQSICCFIDALLSNPSKEVAEVLRSASVDQLKLIYEAYFIYAFMWSVGGSMANDKAINHRKNFNTWLRMNSGKVKFPDNGEPMDYRFDVVSMSWVHWEISVVPYSPIGGSENRIFSRIVVSTVETERMKFNLGLHVKMGKPVLFCGIAGTGKSSVVRDYLQDVAGNEQFTSATINLNSYTDSFALQSMMEGYLDKRTGRTFGPPGNRKGLFFIDDLNMPLVDEYDTQSSAMLLFQLMSHKSVFDRSRLEERKEIADIQFVSCMNPKAGSFMINARLQRFFTVITTYAPTGDSVSQIYSQILGNHLRSFDSPIQALQGNIINATIEVLNSISSNPLFLPSARKFHYQFNLRDVSNIIQGLLNTSSSIYRGSQVNKFLQVWLHECNRIFSDRLIDRVDIEEMDKILQICAKKNLSSSEETFTKDLICTSFVSQHGGNEKQYMVSKDMASLRKVLEEKLAEYNEVYAEMNLVLFDAAIHHITRICRIIDTPCGHALLVGVGGSGKQSLARLACFIMKVDVVSILVNQNYGMNELKLDLQDFYKKAAVKPGTPHAFLLTDSQIADERFLIYINDLLASGHIPDLFSREDMDGILVNLRAAAKAAGVPDDRPAMVQFFQERVQRNLHMIICHSPVGDTFRIRARKFPALISSTTVDVFHPWTRDALFNVASRFLNDVPLLSELKLVDKIASNMSHIHLSIDEANFRFFEKEGRHNYTTPKSFLELISFYKNLLETKRIKVENNIERLDKGLTIMEQVRSNVEVLQEDLGRKMVEVEEKKRATGILIDQVTVASEKAASEKAIADAEAEKTNALAQEAAAIKAQADAELEEALPAMEAAKEAVNCLTKPAIQELKSLGKPPAECTEVTKAVLILLKNEKKNLDWKAAQKMMSNPGQFLDEVAQFNADTIPEWVLDFVNPVITQPFFNYETMKGKSTAAAYLTNWVVNIIGYNKIYKKVAPLMAKVKEATLAKETAEAALSVVLSRVAEVQSRVKSLEKTLSDAIYEKERTEAEANRFLEKLDLAKRLVNGLADENSRWTETVRNLKDQGMTLIGDSLLASAFVGYISPFSSSFRKDLWLYKWVTGISESQIPCTKDIDPLAILASEADIAVWKNEGLPANRMSIENASIITSCARWPLMIDPQLQGVTWLKKRIGDDLVVIQLSQPGWLSKVTQCIQSGGKLLIESVGEVIDAILEPLLSRSVIRRGRNNFVIKIGGEEIEYDPKFQLWIQTKLPNPHYRPEIAAQCTIVNFIVTPDGLEDQILAMVVNVEKAQLEQEKQSLVRKQNDFKVTLSQLEDDLLGQLSRADPATILDDYELVNGLETTKRTANEIQIQVKLAKETEININSMREKYRPVAMEGSMLFFLIIQLSAIEHMYQYSLDSFVGFLYRAIDRTAPSEDIEDRVKLLIESIRITIFKWVNRGLFERHKLILSALLALRLLERGLLREEYNPQELEFLLSGSFHVQKVENPISEWLPNQYWTAVQGLICLPGFELLAQNMERDAPSRFKEWFNEQSPEEVKLPLEWKRLDTSNPLQKLMVLKCLRPDRLTIGLNSWIANAVPNGRQFTECDASSSFYEVLSLSFEDATCSIPIFFILSPGADPVKEVEKLGRKLVNLQINVNYHNIAMGQGQDVIAMSKLEQSHKEGHWIMLQNIHLMPKWCLELEKKLDEFAIEGSHPQFRCFLSADPSPGIPIGLLNRSIKLTNEPPQGLTANLKRSFAFFNKEVFEEKDSKVKAILYGLCHFHSIVLERKKFGPLGFNMMYPFNIGDLRDSALVLYNYLENSSSSRIPWDDLKYIFGEIMYGGHIVDDWDRKLCVSYLDFFMHDGLLDETEMVPFNDRLSIKSPSSGPHEKFIQFIEQFPSETPVMFGLHPNAEIGFRTSQSNTILSLLKQLNLSDLGTTSGEGGSGEEVNRAGRLCSEILEEINSIRFPIEEISKSIPDEEKGPYQYVFLQECDRMNLLIKTMTKSLSELELGLKGELTMSESMEQLSLCLTLEQIPPRWQKVAFPSNRSLLSWLANLKERCAQLEEWTNDPVDIPKVVDLSKLFNPQSFLTAIKQTACQQQNLELDKLTVLTEITKREKSQIDSAAREGAYVTGLYLEGARWDIANGCLEESRPKEMFCQMPIVNCKAVLEDDIKDAKNIYVCPTYATTKRRPNYVFSAQLKTKAPPSKWVLAGVAMVLDIGN